MPRSRTERGPVLTMASNNAEDVVHVRFYPQKWVDSPGEAHHRDKRQLIPAQEHEPITYAVPRADATDASDSVVPDESYEANRLQAHPAAPAWVADWDGPYYVRTDAR